MTTSAQKANRSYFREAYRTGEHGWEADEPSGCALEFLTSLTEIIPGGTLLDLGCGEGRHSIAGAKLGFRVTGVDYEPLALDRARERARAARQEIEFLRASVYRLPFERSSFDVVLDYGCLHHQRKADWRRYRAAVLKVLRPDGFYILSVFSPCFRLFRGSRRSWHIAHGAYRRNFTRADLLDFTGRAFDIERIEQEQPDRAFWHLLLRRRAVQAGMPRTHHRV